MKCKGMSDMVKWITDSVDFTFYKKLDGVYTIYGRFSSPSLGLLGCHRYFDHEPTEEEIKQAKETIIKEIIELGG